MQHHCTGMNTKLLASWATIIDLGLPDGIQLILMNLESLDPDMSMVTIYSWGNVSPLKWLFHLPSLELWASLVHQDSGTFVLTLHGKTWAQVFVESNI